jgi:hypothetical protein
MDTSNKSITNNSQHIDINTSPTVELVDDETVVMFTQNVTTFESRTTPVGDDGNEHFYQHLQNRFSETFLKVLKILHNVPSSDDPWFEWPTAQEEDNYFHAFRHWAETIRQPHHDLFTTHRISLHVEHQLSLLESLDSPPLPLVDPPQESSSEPFHSSWGTHSYHDPTEALRFWNAPTSNSPPPFRHGYCQYCESPMVTKTNNQTTLTCFSC